jgi:hypothetical protein
MINISNKAELRYIDHRYQGTALVGWQKPWLPGGYFRKRLEPGSPLLARSFLRFSYMLTIRYHIVTYLEHHLALNICQTINSYLFLFKELKLDNNGD